MDKNVTGYQVGTTGVLNPERAAENSQPIREMNKPGTESPGSGNIIEGLDPAILYVISGPEFLVLFIEKNVSFPLSI